MSGQFTTRDQPLEALVRVRVRARVRARVSGQLPAASLVQEEGA